MRAYRHYIWDFDGTLFDSYPHSTAALCAALAQFGVKTDFSRVNRLLRTSFATAFEALHVTEEQKKCFRALHGDLTLPPPIVPFPEAGPVLAALSARGARHYLYTHSRRRMSVKFLEDFGLSGYFADFMTPDDPGFTSKPDPGALRRLLARNRIPAGDAAMVGDREIDMRCARGAGIDGILVDADRLVGETCASGRCERLSDLLDGTI